MKLALSLVAVAACADAVQVDRTPRSGARIKLVQYEYDGGAADPEREFFYDDELDTICYERTWSDGARYCTPRAAEAVYANNHCTKPIGIVKTSTVPQFFVTYFDLHEHPLVSALYRVGQPTTPPSVIWRETALGCVGPFDIPAEDTYFYDVGKIVDISAARIRHSDPEGSERLVDLYVSSSDGMRLAVDTYDQDLDVSCRIDGDANAEAAACRPAVVDSYVSYFADADCTTPVIPGDGPTPPAIAQRDDARTGCTTYFRTTTERGPGPLYRMTGGACVPEPNLVASHYYDVRPLELARVERRRVGTGRVRAIQIGHLSITDHLTFDSVLDTDCERVMLPSGELRCLPTSAASIATVFADDQCLRPVDVALVPARSCDTPSRFARDSDVHLIGDVYPSPLYQITTGDRCGAYAVPAGFTPHSIGPAMSMETFPEATMSYDP